MTGKVEAVIFDSEILVIRMWKIVAEKYGIEEIEKVCHECLGTNSKVSREIFLKHYGEDFPYDVYKAEMAALFHSHVSGGRLPKKPGVQELLEFLRENEIKVALASSTREAVVKKELTEGRLISYFDEIVCGDMVKRSKPEPDIFLEAGRRLGVTAERCYVIEDSYNGIRAAHAAGMHPIMVPDLMKPTEEMYALADEIMESLYEVKKFMKDLEK